MKKEKEIISEFYRKIAKRTHKLKPQSKEHYKRMQKLAVKKRLENKANGKKSRNTRKTTGKNNPNWRGGKTPFGLMIRASFQYNEWRLKVYQRDNFTCQECFSSGVKLNADHIEGFSYILQKFLDLNEKIKNSQKLLKLTSKYKPFWDISNGRTLCVPCHRKTKTYGCFGKLIKNYEEK